MSVRIIHVAVTDILTNTAVGHKKSRKGNIGLFAASDIPLINAKVALSASDDTSSAMRNHLAPIVFDMAYHAR